jgi:hypothetical protein
MIRNALNINCLVLIYINCNSVKDNTTAERLLFLYEGEADVLLNNLTQKKSKGLTTTLYFS